MTTSYIKQQTASLQTSLLHKGLWMLPICFEQLSEGQYKLEAIKCSLLKYKPVEPIIDDALIESVEEKSRYAVVLLASTAESLADEIERAVDGVGVALKNGRDWQTPMGSFFTPNPLGSKEHIAFVYPGAFGTYVGMGREIFTLFPQLEEAIAALTVDPDRLLNTEIIFPQSDDPAEIAALQAQLDNSPTMMISSGTCFSYLYTVILQDFFGLKPQAAFGYSLGEISMMFAAGIWTQADGMRTSLETSPVFHERVSGRQNAIREYWGIADEGNGEPIWSNYVLMAPYEKVKDAIRAGERVYVTHINTPRQVVVGGEDQACRRLAEELRCMYLKAPYHHAIHCPPVASEYDHFVHLHCWPVENEAGITVYSAAEYAPLKLETGIVADSFARMLTHTIDFPRLVKRVYSDGARIFIELGAGSNCSKWIDAILKDQPHASMSINQPNVADHVSIIKLLAKLISHRIDVNLTPLLTE